MIVIAIFLLAAVLIVINLLNAVLPSVGRAIGFALAGGVVLFSPVFWTAEVVRNSRLVKGARQRWMQIGMAGRAGVIGLIIVAVSLGWSIAHPTCDQCRRTPPPPMTTI